MFSLPGVPCVESQLWVRSVLQSMNKARYDFITSLNGKESDEIEPG